MCRSWIGKIYCVFFFAFTLLLQSCKRNNPNTRVLNSPIEFYNKGCGSNLQFFAQSTCQMLLAEKQSVALNSEKLDHWQLFFRASRIIPEYYPLFLSLYQRLWEKQNASQNQPTVTWKEELANIPSSSQKEFVNDKFPLKYFLNKHTQSLLGSICKNNVRTDSKIPQPLFSLLLANQSSPFQLFSSSKAAIFEKITQKQGAFDEVLTLENVLDTNFEKSEHVKVFEKLKPWDIWLFSASSTTCSNNFKPEHLAVVLEKEYFLETKVLNNASFFVGLKKRQDLFQALSTQSFQVPLKLNGKLCAKVYRTKLLSKNSLASSLEKESQSLNSQFAVESLNLSQDTNSACRNVESK